MQRAVGYLCECLAESDATPDVLRFLVTRNDVERDLVRQLVRHHLGEKVMVQFAGTSLAVDHPARCTRISPDITKVSGGTAASSKRIAVSPQTGQVSGTLRVDWRMVCSSRPAWS